MLVLSGGSYIFFIPVVFGLVTFFITYYLKDKLHSYVRSLIIGLNILIGLILFIPIFYLIYLALTIGALAIVGLLSFFPFIMIASSGIYIY